MPYNWTPWQFSDRRIEADYSADRALSWARLDRGVVVPWGLLWLSIIKRHWHALTYLAILKSFCYFIVIVSPSYLQLLMGHQRYVRHRKVIVTVAKAAYVFHAGGGLYRDGVMAVSNTALGAANLFVRLAVGSRTLFWLVLAFGYQLPPFLQAPIDAVLVGSMMWMKPSGPFCQVMQSPDTQPLFHAIANALPLVSLIPLGRPLLVEGADVCNPLIAWMQIGMGYLLPLLSMVCIDVVARRRFATRHRAVLPAEDDAVWVANKTASVFNPWTILALVYPHLLTALWYFLMWNQLEFPPTYKVTAPVAPAVQASA